MGIAVMHKLVFVIFAVLRDRKPFVLRKPEEHAKTLINLRPQGVKKPA
jgi:transposase